MLGSRGDSNQPLIQEISRLQASAESLRADLAVAKGRLNESRANERILTVYAEASYWMVSKKPLDETSSYGYLCAAATRILGWDGALVISWPKAECLASAGATLKQKETGTAILSADDTMGKRALSRALFSSLSGTEREGLILRAAFQADQVIAVPISVGRKRAEYLIVTTKDGRNAHLTAEEAHLAKFAAAAGNLIELVHLRR